MNTDSIAVGVVGRNQIIFKDKKYNWHRNNFNNKSVYRCVFRNKHKCLSEITIQTPSYQVIDVTEHNCENYITSELDWHKKEAIKEYIKKTGANKAREIAMVLNKDLKEEEKNNPTLFILPKHVKKIQRSLYTEKIDSIEDLNKPPYSSTLDHGEFLQIFTVQPCFLLLYASEFQLNLLRQYEKPDQLYVDGTFRCVPPGITQLVTIRLRKSKEADSKLVAIALLRSKKAVDYVAMWSSITHLVKKFLECECIVNVDFEKAHHKALHEQFGERVVIIGCFFHLLQAVHKWIKKKGDTFLKDEDNRKDLDEDIRNLAETRNFDKVKVEFREKYAKQAPLFFQLFYSNLPGFKCLVSTKNMGTNHYSS